MHIEMLCFFDQSHGNLGFALTSCPVTFCVTKSKTEITLSGQYLFVVNDHAEKVDAFELSKRQPQQMHGILA